MWRQGRRQIGNSEHSRFECVEFWVPGGQSPHLSCLSLVLTWRVGLILERGECEVLSPLWVFNMVDELPSSSFPVGGSWLFQSCQWSSPIKIHANHLGILLKCRLWVGGVWCGWRGHISKMLPGDHCAAHKGRTPKRLEAQDNDVSLWFSVDPLR